MSVRDEVAPLITTLSAAEPVPPKPAPQPKAESSSPQRRLRSVGTAGRLAAFHAVVLCAILALVVLGLYRAFEAQSLATTTRNLVAEVQGYGAAAQARPHNESLRSFSQTYLGTHVIPDGELVVIALRGQGLLGSTGSEALLGSAVVQQWARQAPAQGVARRATVADRHYSLLAAPVYVDGQSVGTVIAAADLQRTQADQSRVLLLAVGEALVALLAGVAGVYLLLRRLLRTVGRITATAAGIGRGELDRRLGDQGTDDEVGQLAATFDAMADQLAGAMTIQRRLLSDVSHQLRTPLTVARGHLEVLNRTAADDPLEVHRTVSLVVDELDHMRALVEQLLFLGRALEPDFLDREPIDLRSFLADISAATRVLASRRWRLKAVPDLVLLADAPKLRGALLNLVDNAVRATKNLNVIEISAVQLPDGAVVLAVEDSGPGIPAELRRAVLERFSRPGAVDTEGSGLGLAIVQTVAQAHGGSIELGTSPLGGCRAAIVLPSSVVAFADQEI